MLVERKSDMSPSARLRVFQQEDGDMIVAIVPGSLEEARRMGFSQSVEFCSVGTGGGKSPKTVEALRALMDAMEEDGNQFDEG